MPHEKNNDAILLGDGQTVGVTDVSPLTNEALTQLTNESLAGEDLGTADTIIHGCSSPGRTPECGENLQQSPARSERSVGEPT